MKKLVLIIIPVLLIIALIICGYLWKNRPIALINEAFEKQDYVTVVKYYDKLKLEANKQYVRDRLSEAAEERYNHFLGEKITFEEAKDFFDILEKKPLVKNEKTLEYEEKLEIVAKSRECYSQGLAYEKQEDYLNAFLSFIKVDALDTVYYSEAQNHVAANKQFYCNSVAASADKLIATEDYEAAKECVEKGLLNVPDNAMLLAKLEEIEEYLNPDIDQSYSTIYNLGNLLAKELGVKDRELYFPVELVFAFGESNMRMYIVKSSIKPAIEALTEDEASMEAMYEVAKNYGINKTEADLLIGIMYGGSYADFIMDKFEDEINDALSDFNMKTKYCADNQYIYVGTDTPNTHDYIAYSMEAKGGMKLSSYKGNNKSLKELEYPLILE